MTKPFPKTSFTQSKSCGRRSALLAGFVFFMCAAGNFTTSAGGESELQEEFFKWAKKGDVQEIERHLTAGALLEGKNEDGYTALIYAAYYGQEPAVRFLIEKGADPCAEDEKGNTALLGAIFKGNPEVSRLLSGYCDLNHQNRSGQTALMYASLFGREEIAKLLIEKGARTDTKDHQGRDAQALAESQLNQAMIQVLKFTRVIKK